MLGDMNHADRLRLIQFVCSFAWADLEVRPEERSFVGDLVRRLELSADEELQVQQWLEVPPEPESIDPTAVPRAHRQAFLEAIEGLIAADGEVSEEERESFAVFTQLLGD
jgi:uncharacterized tellurite resistance protein B-like protein